MDAIEKRALSNLQTIVDRWDADPFAAMVYDVSQDRRVIRECLALVKRLTTRTTPEGYVLVPAEPTEAMLRARAECGRDAFAVDEWAAMLAARPEAP